MVGVGGGADAGRKLCVATGVFAGFRVGGCARANDEIASCFRESLSGKRGRSRERKTRFFRRRAVGGVLIFFGTDVARDRNRTFKAMRGLIHVTTFHRCEKI